MTNLPKFYHDVTKELKEEGLSFISLKLGDDVPRKVDLVVTSLSERDSVDFPKVVAAASAKDAVRNALYLKEGLKSNYKSISVGIDPGKSIGIAAMAEGRIIHERNLRSPEEIVPYLKEIEEQFRPERTTIKVGSAGGAYRNRIIASVQEGFNHSVEIVDEGSTTKPKRELRRLGMDKDILAARKIAFKKGRRIKEKVTVITTDGEIKNMQRESREKSEHLTISKRLAEAVVKGELDIEEALRLQKKRNEDIHTS